ncbi:ribonuclease HI [Pseudomonas sp. AF76]|uniref:ribonuclease H family protein n=1 Tax=Pseudomonas sp. AF76 TaxID=554393 RepID=UPI000F48CD5E|nr:ribonuclease H [Pseudomonas sp. AF76]ROO36958.1 ribonuclease HI [Pseudomonas sp. AF76]
MTTYNIYVDGACPNNGKPNAKAGWGALLINPQGDTLELAGPVPFDQTQTNGRAELLAALMAIRRCKPGMPITVISDSDYVVKGATEWLPGWKARGWKKADKKPVEHADLWSLIDQLMQTRDIRFLWVRGHSGNAGNERADALACRGARGERIEALTKAAS